MSNDLIFSWAENTDGRLVHVDSVSNGLQCGCVCPHCHERLLARHGKINEHGFAHHSDNRGANLKICYMVTLYKLAEQILQTKKYIHVPSYYGIFKEKNIYFEDVKIDSSYEREDKQPDVIGTTQDEQQYFVEFVFRYKVQHKQALDYKKFSCLEIDLSNQTLDSLEDFLLHSDEDRKWLNNENYFSKIESLYANAGKTIRIVEVRECGHCEISHKCCAVKQSKYSSSPITIENSGFSYRLCKTELFKTTMEKHRQCQADEAKRQHENELRFQERKRLHNQKLLKKHEVERERQKEYEERRKILDEQKASGEQSGRTCFDCQSNLFWMNRNGMANCGSYISMRVPKVTSPDCAKNCKGFKRIIKL